jgi:hypothetical protein
VHPRLVITLTPDAPDDAGAWIDDALPDALARLGACSLALARRSELRQHQTQAAFARATGKRSPWLRAWAGYAVVHLLPPATWSDPARPARVERLAHELTHLAIYQGLGDEADARRVAPPFWFVEGAASVVARQGARRLPLAEVVARARDRNPLVRADALLEREHHLAYGAAHHAVEALFADHGLDVVARVVAAARKAPQRGALGRAVREVCGVDADALWSRVAEGDLTAHPAQ